VVIRSDALLLLLLLLPSLLLLLLLLPTHTQDDDGKCRVDNIIELVEAIEIEVLTRVLGIDTEEELG